MFFTLRSLWHGPTIHDWLSTEYQNVHHALPSAKLPPFLLPTEPPDDYRHVSEQSTFCEHRLGLAYLEELRHTRATYCSSQSPSQMTCFHVQTEAKDRVDSFCISQAATFNQSSGRFQIPCDTVEPWGIETNESSVSLARFNRYWYETGPATVIGHFVDLDPKTHTPASNQNGTNIILVKREGSTNTWHSLMEIMSLSLSIDVLQMSPGHGEEGYPFLSDDDSENTQVVILDNHEDGPYFDLWRLFAKKPTLRLADLASDTSINNIIIPLPGGSNPIWRSDWEANSCAHSALLQTFSRRVLRHLEVSDSKASGETTSDKVVVTFIHRRGTRKLVDIEQHIAALQHRYTHARIQLIDLAALPFREQVQIVRDSDILAGVHGAGLTHGLWMRERAAMVEILPVDLHHKGFRNLAGAMGHAYFSIHGAAVGDGTAVGDWQQDDVVLDQSRFLELMDVAIKSMYNAGRHNFDLSE